MRLPALAAALARELAANRLTVRLKPHPVHRGQFVRVVIQRSPEWYSEFCRRHASCRKGRRRKFQTLIKRRETLEMLARIARFHCRGAHTTSVYYQRLLAIMTWEQERMRDEERFERAQASRRRSRPRSLPSSEMDTSLLMPF